jgi:uncharacterized repeat protein (TIGR01451 family)
VTDTVGSGVLFDWGFPVVAVRDLTPQVLIGLGFGCTDNDCKEESYNDKETRSVVWVSPVEDADIYVDYQNDGEVDSKFEVNYLNSQVIHDDNDQDMSGAVIFATKRGSGPDGPQVNFAAAWGQDPERSGSNDESALDLGTQVVPFLGFQASSKIVELVDDNDNDGQISPGDKIKYTIVVSNVGQQDIPTGGATIKDTLDPNVAYAPFSLRYFVPETGESVDIPGESFPLEGDGLPSQFPFLKRGGTAEVSFEVTINDVVPIGSDTIKDEGSINFGSGDVPFKLELRLGFSAKLDIEKTVFKGHGTESDCNGSELLTGEIFDDVTFCFEVTNTGREYLASIQVEDPELGFVNTSIGILAPGETKTVIMLSTMTGEQMSMAEVTGIPVNQETLERIPGTPTVRAEDDAGVEIAGVEDPNLLCE